MAKKSMPDLILTVTGTTSLPALPCKGEEIRVPRYEDECDEFFIDVTREDYGGLRVASVDHLWVKGGVLQPRINIEFSVHTKQDFVCLIHQLDVWLIDLTGWVSPSSSVYESFAYQVPHVGDEAKKLCDAIIKTLPKSK